VGLVEMLFGGFLEAFWRGLCMRELCRNVGSIHLNLYLSDCHIFKWKFSVRKGAKCKELRCNWRQAITLVTKELERSSSAYQVSHKEREFHFWSVNKLPLWGLSPPTFPPYPRRKRRIARKKKKKKPPSYFLNHTPATTEPPNNNTTNDHTIAAS
jgi:hypothetical protein